MGRLRRLVARVQAARGYRAWTRYSDAQGNILAGGIAYMAFFSVIPALILGLSVFGLILRNQPDLYDSVVSSVSGTLPGVIRDAANPHGLIDASRPPTPNALTVAGLISLGTLLVAGLGWLSALRGGVRAVFGQPKLATDIVRSKVRDLAVMIVLGLAFLVSAVLSTGVNAASTWLLTQLGVGTESNAGQLLLRAAAVLVVLIVDASLMVVIFRLLTGLRLPREDLLQGALVGAVGLGVIKLASGLLLASAARKPVLGSFAVLVGLLLVLNLIARVVLLAAAWAATTADERGRLTRAVPRVASARSDATSDLDGARGSGVALAPTFGQRSADRTTLAAGAVLGAMAMVSARVVGKGARAALSAVRGRGD